MQGIYDKFICLMIWCIRYLIILSNALNFEAIETYYLFTKKIIK